MFSDLSSRRIVSLIALGFIFAAISALLLFSGDWGREGRSAGTNINSTDRWAWNDVIGWIDFYTSDTVLVGNSKISGYASSSVGEISLDCATPPAPTLDLCATKNYAVLNDGAGNLSGWAWNDAIGWISFCGGQNTSACPGVSPTYQVVVNGTTGEFSGYAWNDVVGWIRFNCFPDTPGTPGTPNCLASNFKLKTVWISTSTTGWLESATFDTGVAGGAQINSITWRGAPPNVRFQMAFSNATSGPWTFGWDATASISPFIAPNAPSPVDYTLGANQRYFRYRIHLYSDPAHTISSRVDDVVVNWSR